MSGGFGAVDAQFSLKAVLKPQDGFEAFYQGEQAVTVPTAGQAVSVPVPFFEWVDGRAPDPRSKLAREDGFNPNLLNFMAVPFGAKVKLLIPMIFFGATPFLYRYMVVWRVRSLAAANLLREGSYHSGDERVGAPDTSALFVDGPRVALPAVTHTVITSRAAQTNAILSQTSDVRREYLVVDAPEAPFTPLIAAGEFGVYQQGIVDPSVDLVTGLLPTFVEVQMESFGDEMLVVADRECVDDGEGGCLNPLWDFAGVDQGFSNIYGTNPLGTGATPPHANFPDSGIWVFTGTAP